MIASHSHHKLSFCWVTDWCLSSGKNQGAVEVRYKWSKPYRFTTKAFHAFSKFMLSCYAYSDVLWLDFMSYVPPAEAKWKVSYNASAGSKGGCKGLGCLSGRSWVRSDGMAMSVFRLELRLQDWIPQNEVTIITFYKSVGGRWQKLGLREPQCHTVQTKLLHLTAGEGGLCTSGIGLPGSSKGTKCIGLAESKPELLQLRTDAC